MEVRPQQKKYIMEVRTTIEEIKKKKNSSFVPLPLSLIVIGT
jgi:hypothetical protein